jgi:hypothetical protein
MGCSPDLSVQIIHAHRRVCPIAALVRSGIIVVDELNRVEEEKTEQTK